MLRPTWGFVLLAGCATVETETHLRHTQGLERCDDGDLVAAAYPGDWPEVIIEVQQERTCATPVEDEYDVERSINVSRDVATGVAAGVGAVAGLAADIVLMQLMERSGAYSSSSARGEELLALPLLGAVVFGSIVQGHQVVARQTISHDVRVDTSYLTRHEEDAAYDGELSAAVVPLGPLRGGHVRVPLDVATRVYGRTLQLGARRVSWSVRPRAWVPGLLPACERAARVWQARGFEQLPVPAIQAASDDAEACARDGWPFAETMVNRLAQTCRERFKTSCAHAH